MSPTTTPPIAHLVQYLYVRITGLIFPSITLRHVYRGIDKKGAPEPQPNYSLNDTRQKNFERPEEDDNENYEKMKTLLVFIGLISASVLGFSLSKLPDAGGNR